MLVRMVPHRDERNLATLCRALAADAGQRSEFRTRPAAVARRLGLTYDEFESALGELRCRLDEPGASLERLVAWLTTDPAAALRPAASRSGPIPDAG